ncbi:glycosyltransferase family 9 protein [Ralstonia soli]|uniref:Glycosyltransferase family 9 protein n=1 Tax=Ralstonia soli TaxID=2953896 RepID=A0ABT1APV5_9RALS|nr:glycosyltransferase family 9 protein [Ralstonia soli]MCO5400476.1 glycosyltransferase family 9 protein [Ralstonia soli]
MTPSAELLRGARRIAVFRALQLGDMLCAVPALRALRAAAPQAHITLVGLPWARQFQQRYADLLDDFVAFPGGEGFPEAGPADAQTTHAFYAEMRARCLDVAIQLHGSGPQSTEVVRQFGAHQVFGFQPDGGIVRQGNTALLPWPTQLPEAQRLLALLDHLGAPAVPAAPDFPLTRDDYAEALALLRRHALDRDRLVCLHPGARMPTRRWWPERFAAVADTLIVSGFHVAITGAPSEGELVEQVRRRMRQRATSVAGQTSLGGLAALLRLSRLLICNDTGVSHVAAAVRAPSLVIACGSDVARWAPADRTLHRVLAAYPPCRPCMHWTCPTGHECAGDVTVRQALDAAYAALFDPDVQLRASHTDTATVPATLEHPTP